MNPKKVHLITGATGLLGSHIAEQLAAQGETVRALVRAGSDVNFLRGIGAQLALGDLADPVSLRAACEGADVVYHCASRVGDFGNWKTFRAEVVDSTRNLLEACKSAGVGRFLHVSSVAVYGQRPRIPPGGLTEDTPIRKGFRLGDSYGRAKALAEDLVRCSIPDATIIRPTWMIGPRDRHGLPRLLQALRGGWVSTVGSGNNLLNIIHAADVARGAILAAESSQARGQTYNLCSAGEITQRQFLEALCALEGVSPITRRFPLRLAYVGGFLSEWIARILRFRRAPHISRYTVARLSRSTDYRIDKARRELGWQPQVGIRDALPAILAAMPSDAM